MSRPRDLCHHRWHFHDLRPQRREAARVERVAPRESPRRTGGETQVPSDPTDDILAPPAGLLLGEDVVADSTSRASPARC